MLPFLNCLYLIPPLYYCILYLSLMQVAGAMFTMAELKGTKILGLPACVIYSSSTISYFYFYLKRCFFYIKLSVKKEFCNKSVKVNINKGIRREVTLCLAR